MIVHDQLQSQQGQSLDALLQLQRLDAANSYNRSSERFGIRCKVELHAGDCIRRTEPPIAGVCGDVSAGGCRVIADMPPYVGSIYWIAFEKSVSLPPVYARCVRCRLLREDAFEAGFQFFNEITLPNAPQSEDGDDFIDVV